MTRENVPQTQQQKSTSHLLSKGILQRKCSSCGQHSLGGGKCANCKKKHSSLLQRKVKNRQDFSHVPSSVYRTLRSPGQPLDSTTSTYMGSRFGRDFSHVRVHTSNTNNSAAKSANEVNALAYTLGHHIVFGEGQYNPGTNQGKKLIAHELVHVIQQEHATDSIQKRSSAESTWDIYEHEADRIAEKIVSGNVNGIQDVTPAPHSLQRKCYRQSAELGSVGGCVATGGDITDIGSSSDQIYLSEVNCDSLRPSEEMRIREQFSSLIGPTDLIEIHGFASEEGSAEFNDNLSCSRAHEAKRILLSLGIDENQISLFKHGEVPGDRVDRRSVIILHNIPKETSQLKTKPKTEYVACYDGSTIFVNKNGKMQNCQAVTGTAGEPTPNGEYCIRLQGKAQRTGGLIGMLFQDRDKWYLLEPQFKTTRYRMMLHPGRRSEGCVTVTNESCFDQLADVLNSPGVITRTGYDGYPPGNKANNGKEVTNPEKSVTCLGLLLVNRTSGACKSF